jgi:biotin carboxyl carrier protein
MKKMHVTVNGIKFDVEVEVYEDDENILAPQQYFIPHHRYNENISNVQANALFSKQTQKLKQTLKQKADSNVLSSPINGVVLEILVNVGNEVEENQVLFVLESMKMKTNISSPRAGKIKAIHIKVGDSVETGQLLMEYE